MVVYFFVYQAAIVNATSLEEVERLNQMLKTGQVPGKDMLNKKHTGMLTLTGGGASIPVWTNFLLIPFIN